VAAEVLFSVGILTGWIGGKNEIGNAQETAKNLITESIIYFESVNDVKKIAAARTEIAYCYFREGALNEARIMLTEALQTLTAAGNTRARALLRLAIVDCTASRFSAALAILTENALLFQRITNHSIKGAYHSQLAITLRSLAAPENRTEYFQRAVTEYKEADDELRRARNAIFRADVKNNIAFLLYKLNRLKEAHKYLDEARRLTVNLRNKVRTAQIDETRAQVLIAEKKFKEAEAVARGAVSVFQKSGQQCLLIDALITHGIALARLNRTERAQFTFQKAVEIAHQVDARNKAGLAALTLIEEIVQLPINVLQTAHANASEWLADCESEGLLQRLNQAARKVISRMTVEGKTDDTPEALFNKGCHLPAEVLKFERGLIRTTLAKVNGSVTRAASMLGISYQRLAYVIESRHKDLLKERSPIRRRSRKDK
jgi:tetratricopeptide (TPR) repeat protein